MPDKVAIADLRRLKVEGGKSVCVVAWDYHLARIADRAGVDIVSVGDTVGLNLWGHQNPLEVTMDQLLVVAQAVRRGVSRALVSCDFPFGPLQEGVDEAVRAAIRLVKEAGVDLVKLDGAADFPEAVEAITRAGIPVFAQFGLSPQTALRHGTAYDVNPGARQVVPAELTDVMVADARRLEAAGAALLNFTNSGPVAGPAVVDAVSVPVLGGHGGGPWLDGRIRLATAALGYSASAIDDPPDTYAQVASIALEAFETLVADVRAGRQIQGGIPVEQPGDIVKSPGNEPG